MPTISRRSSSHLDLNRAIHVGHSTGGGEVARYIGRHGTKRVAKAVLIGAVTPLMLKTASKPGWNADRRRSTRFAPASSRTARSSSWTSRMPFYGYNRPGAKVSQGVRDVILAVRA